MTVALEVGVKVFVGLDVIVELIASDVAVSTTVGVLLTVYVRVMVGVSVSVIVGVLLTVWVRVAVGVSVSVIVGVLLA
ncbi:MAG: hypothetical protein ACK46D_02745, partial [Roseiflexaceae bacterium]